MIHQLSTLNFYASLPSFVDFREVAELELYHALPDDWTLLVSDVIASTQAIEMGKYKNVNMIGAASIIAILNVRKDVQLPFVFGGDGSMVAVPPDLLGAASIEMKRLQAASLNMFGLALRAAAIPVADLRSNGADTLVRKFCLSKDNHLAMFAGSGPMVADQWLKEDETSMGYALNAGENEELPDLDNLSCRWEPLKSRNGTMLTIILLPSALNLSAEIITATETISQILGGQLSDFAPAHDATMEFRFPPAGLALEISANARYSTKLKRTLWTYFTALMQYFCERFGIQIGSYNGATYRDEVQSNTDYRKYDGSLRMVLDVTAKQSAEILAFLDKENKSGRLAYGSWQSDEALMTCLLFDLTTSRHLHFIDGSRGGYAMAAKDMKQRQLVSVEPK